MSQAQSSDDDRAEIHEWVEKAKEHVKTVERGKLGLDAALNKLTRLAKKASPGATDGAVPGKS